MRRLALSALILILAVPAPAQKGDDPAAEMREWMRGQREDFESFVSEQDREFAAFLAESWREFELSAARVRDVAPKPKRPPRAPVAETPPPPAPVPDAAPLPTLPTPTPPPPAPSVRPGAREVDLKYLGLVYRLPLDEPLRRLPRREPGPDAAGDAWLALSEVDTAPLLESLDRYRTERRLGDWGTFLLLQTVAEECYPVDSSRRALLHWFLACRLGLDTRLAYARPGFVVLYATEQSVFQVEFLMRDKSAYYIHDPEGRFASVDKMRTYDSQPPGDLRPLAFDLSRLPVTEPDLVVRNFCWDLGGRERELELPVDRQLVAYLASVPQVGLETNFTAALSPVTLESLGHALAPDLTGRSETARVGVLLHFVQTALPYATDHEQFGREDYLYPDETLFHPACDCEDRAALFALLVRRLVGLDVVGLDYPGHIATAVALPEDHPGDRFSWHSVYYTVCDPTYIGAGIGRSMPIAGADRPGIIAAGS